MGIIVAFALYVERLFDPIREVTTNFEQLQRTVVSADRIFELLDIPLGRGRPAQRRLADPRAG